MKTRVTQTDIARVAGVHNTTVSLALRNSQLIPDATRERIRAVATRMGYCPDPALRALVAYRNSRRQNRQPVTIAYATNWSTRWGWKEMIHQEKYYEGAKRKAAEYGYHLEHFWLGEEGMSLGRFNQMLVHRGIRGLLLAAHDGCSDELPGIDWSRLSAVKIGSFPRSPALHQVTVDQAGITNLAVRRIRETGRHRIGFVVPHDLDRLSDQAWSRAILAEQAQLPNRERLPVLRLAPLSPDNPVSTKRVLQSDDTQKLATWYDQHQPEAIVSFTPAMLEHLGRLGLETPRDVAYVDLCLADAPASAGVNQNSERIGEIAVEMLAAQLEQNIFGAPAVPTITSVTGTWIEGHSLTAAREITAVATAQTAHLVA